MDRCVCGVKGEEVSGSENKWLNRLNLRFRNWDRT